MYYAHTDRAGIITISQTRNQKDLLLLAEGEGQAFKDKIEVNARLAYDGVTLLVPGIPEAEDDSAALIAAQKFSALLGQRPVFSMIDDRSPKDLKSKAPGVHR